MERSERHKLYKRALKLLRHEYKNNRKCGLCWAILQAAQDLELLPSSQLLQLDPFSYAIEIREMDTGVRYVEIFGGIPCETNFWFDPCDTESRIKILKKCIKMTK